MKRVLSMLLVCALLLSIPMMPLPAEAATAEVNITDPTSQCPCCGVPMDKLEWIPFDASVGATPPAGHYYLAADYNQTSVKNVMAWDKVVLDLRGHKWSSYTTTVMPNNSSYRMMTISGYFYLMDTAGGGVVEAQMKPNYGGAFLLDDNEHGEPMFHLLSGTIRPRAGEEAATNGGFIYSRESGIVKMSGGCIENFVATTGSGGAILGSVDSQILISGGIFKNCKAKAYGGAISALGKLEVKNATFLNCTATSVGGAIHASAANGNLIENTQFISCKGSDGGAVYADDNMTMIGCAVMNCTATGANGGGVSLVGKTHTIQDTKFIGNTAKKFGGNLSQIGGKLTATNVTFEHGVANCIDGTAQSLYYGGGNCYINESATTEFIGGTFRDGYSANHGGNLFARLSTVTLKGTEVTGGVSYKTGDNIRTYNAAMTLDGANIEGDMVFELNTLTLKNATKIGLKNTGLCLYNTATRVTATELTEGAEVYIQASAAATLVNAGADIAYFKPAYRTVLAGGDGAAITATIAADGVTAGYCPHCKTQVAWTAYTGQNATGHFYMTAAKTANYNIAVGTDLVIDLNGMTLTNSAARFVNLGTLTIMDSGAGTWTQATQWTGGMVKGGGLFWDNYKQNGGIIHNNGIFNLYGGTLVYTKKDNGVVSRGGVVYIYSGTMNMYGGVLDGSAYDNTASTGWVVSEAAPEGVGGAFYQNSGSTFKMTAGRMIGGTAYAGGTAGFGGNVTTIITGGSFHGGKATATATYTGGNLFFPGADEAKGNVSVSNVSITDGTSASAGGNVAFGRYYTTTFDNCFIADGTTTGSGGNLAMITAGLATVKNSYILSGTAFAGGNVALNGTSANIALDTCRVIDGKTTGAAGSNGGNLIASKGNATINGGELIYGVAGNENGGVGGNICCGASGTVKVQKNAAGEATKILGGYAKYGGNITVMGPVTLTDAVIGGGDAMYNGKDIQIYGDYANLTVSSGVTGKASVWPKEENGVVNYGAALGGTTSTGLSSDLHMFVESLSTKPLITAKGGALTVSGVQFVDALGNTQWCANYAEAEAETENGGYVKLYANTDLTLTKDTYVDLNGKTATVSGSGKLLGMDTSGDNYAVPTGSVTFTGASPVEDKSLVYAPNGNKYVALVEGNEVSFHRLGMDLTNVTININKNAVYFKGAFGADSKLKDLVATYGIAVSIDSMPNKDNLESAQKSTFQGAQMENNAVTSGVYVTNILQDDLTAEQNKARGETPIHATAYVTLKDGSTIYTSDRDDNAEDNIAWSLHDVFTALDNLIKDDPTNYRTYTNTMREYYAKWKDKGIGDWVGEETNFVEPEEDDVIDILMIGSSFCTYYVQEMWQIAEAAGIKMRVCNVYYSGCPLSKYYTDWLNGTAAYQFYETTGPERKSYTGSKSLEWCLAQGDWDVISMQEYSGNIRGAGNNGENHLNLRDQATDALFPYITSQFPDAKFYFHQSWSFQKEYKRDKPYVLDDAQQAYDAYQQQVFALGLLKKYGDPATSGTAGSEFQCLDGRVPTGEAWQLVREGFGGYAPYDNLCMRTSTTNNLGDYYHDGDLGGGQYLNGLVWFFKITNDLGYSFTPEDIKWEPDNGTYGYNLATGLNLEQLRECAWEAVNGDGWTYDAEKYKN